jgi:hypothetical protein
MTLTHIGPRPRCRIQYIACNLDRRLLTKHRRQSPGSLP